MNSHLIKYLVGFAFVSFQSSYGQSNIAISSLNFKTENLRELRTEQSIITPLVNSQVVFLGEAAHGDGTTLAAKNELIKYLISNHGFEVILFERSFYELNKVNSLLKEKNLSQVEAQILLKSALKNEIFISKELQAISAFIAVQRSKINIGGIGLTSRSQVLKLIGNDLLHFGVKRRDANKYLSLLTDLTRLEVCSNCETEYDFAGFYSISNQLIKTIQNANHMPEVGLMTQILKSNIRLADWVRLRPKTTSRDYESLKKFIHEREKGLYENLLWQLNTLYKEKKVIVSTATFHMTLSKGAETMVNYLPDSIKQKSYFLPFIRYQGKSGYDTKLKIFGVSDIEQDSSSIESLLHATSHKFSFIDFSSLSENARDQINNMTMNPSEIIDNDLKWLDTYNGLFFIDTMKPDHWNELPTTFEKDLKKILNKVKR